jgi:hypothetical protein
MMIVIYEMGIMWKHLALSCFKILSQYVAGGLKKETENLDGRTQSWESNLNLPIARQVCWAFKHEFQSSQWICVCS